MSSQFTAWLDHERAVAEARGVEKERKAVRERADAMLAVIRAEGHALSEGPDRQKRIGGSGALIAFLHWLDTERVPARPEPETCAWTEEDYAIWATGCGKTFQFDDAGPTENRFSFCPYCGKALTLAAPKSEPYDYHDGNPDAVKP